MKNTHYWFEIEEKCNDETVAGGWEPVDGKYFTESAARHRLNTSPMFEDDLENFRIVKVTETREPL